MYNLEKELSKQKKQTEQTIPEIAGRLGTPIGGQKRVEVPGRNAYVYVCLRSNQSELIQAYNNKVAPSYNLPVRVKRQGNRYVVIGMDSQRYDNNWNSQSAFVPRHGNSHSFDIETGGGGDVVWVYPRQFMPTLVMPSGSVGGDSVIVNPYTLQKGSSWIHVGNTGTASFSPYLPTSPTGSIMVLVCLNTETENPELIVNSGTVFSNSITGSSQIPQYIPSIPNPITQIPLAAVRLITGTNKISWDNIYDVRQFVQPVSTGTGGASTFLELSDTPASYAGASGTIARVKYTEDGVEFPEALDEIIMQERDDVEEPGGHHKVFIDNNGALAHKDNWSGTHFLSWGTLDNAYQETRAFTSTTTGTSLTDDDYPIQSLLGQPGHVINDIWVLLPTTEWRGHPFIVHNSTTGSVAHIYDSDGHSDTLVPGQSGWFLSRAELSGDFRYITMTKSTPALPD